MTADPRSKSAKPNPKHWIMVLGGFVCRFLVQDYASWGICSSLILD